MYVLSDIIQGETKITKKKETKSFRFFTHLFKLLFTTIYSCYYLFNEDSVQNADL